MTLRERAEWQKVRHQLANQIERQLYQQVEALRREGHIVSLLADESEPLVLRWQISVFVSEPKENSDALEAG
jgi:hypothetical protein